MKHKVTIEKIDNGFIVKDSEGTRVFQDCEKSEHYIHGEEGEKTIDALRGDHGTPRNWSEPEHYMALREALYGIVDMLGFGYDSYCKNNLRIDLNEKGYDAVDGKNDTAV